jgi:hypothetical protein
MLSTLNWTPTTPPASVALAASVAAPEIVAPDEGAVTATTGGVVSTVTTALASFDGWPRFPAPSAATTR